MSFIKKGFRAEISKSEGATLVIQVKAINLQGKRMIKSNGIDLNWVKDSDMELKRKVMRMKKNSRKS